MRRWRLPGGVFWLGLGGLALWGQELSGGLDLLSPLMLVWLQRGRVGPAAVAAVLVTVVQEGLASFVLGATLANAGLWLGFSLTAWRLDPFNPLVMAGFALFAAAWTPLAHGMVAMLHDVAVPFPSLAQLVIQAGALWGAWVAVDWLVARRQRDVSV